MRSRNKGLCCGILCRDEELAGELGRKLRLFAGVKVERISNWESGAHCDIMFTGITEAGTLGLHTTPVIVIGNQVTPECLEKVLAGPASSYLAHPFHLNSLRECLQQKAQPRDPNQLSHLVLARP